MIFNYSVKELQNTFSSPSTACTSIVAGTNKEIWKLKSCDCWILSKSLNTPYYNLFWISYNGLFFSITQFSCEQYYFPSSITNLYFHMEEKWISKYRYVLLVTSEITYMKAHLMFACIRTYFLCLQRLSRNLHSEVQTQSILDNKKRIRKL